MTKSSASSTQEELLKMNLELQEANRLVKMQQHLLIKETRKTATLEMAMGVYRGMITPLLSLEGQSLLMKLIIGGKSVVVNELNDELEKMDEKIGQLAFVANSLEELVKGQNPKDQFAFNLGELIEKTVSIYQFKESRSPSNCEIISEIDENAYVNTSPSIIYKVVSSLISWALQRHKDKGDQGPKAWIKVRLKKDKDTVFIEIEDNASNPIDDHIDDPFAPFALPVVQRPESCLDLFIVKALFEELGGELDLISGSESLTFLLRLKSVP